MGKHDRTQRLIKFYKSFEKEKFRYMIGWIKYTQEITTIEETESPLPQLPEVEEPTVRQGIVITQFRKDLKVLSSSYSLKIIDAF